jgi:predicted nucleic acid-binding Zn ribbon protein
VWKAGALKDKRRRGETSSLGDALRRYVDRAGIGDRMAQASVVSEWAAIVGPKIADVTVPTSVAADGTLFVRVRSAGWAQELQLMSPSILAELGKRGKRVKRIVWRTE